MPEQITFVLTSSNRFDLLQRTMDSFLALNTYPVARYIISEDGNNKKCYDKIKNRYGDIAEVILQPVRLGCSLHLDTLLGMVKTPWVFTCEDDWLFEHNPKFLEDSLSVMIHHPYVNQVWIRHAHDHSHPLNVSPTSIGGVPIRRVLKGYQGVWNGFTFNPGLRRMDDWRIIFPNGFHEFGDEIDCARHADTVPPGYLAYSLVNSAIKHIGWNRHTPGFKI